MLKKADMIATHLVQSLPRVQHSLAFMPQAVNLMQRVFRVLQDAENSHRGVVAKGLHDRTRVVPGKMVDFQKRKVSLCTKNARTPNTPSQNC